MCPYAAVTEGSNNINFGYIEGSESSEAGRADWANTIAAVSINVLTRRLFPDEAPYSTNYDITLLVNKLDMPFDLATLLVSAAEHGKRCRVECTTIFENGMTSGDRHYDDFREVK